MLTTKSPGYKTALLSIAVFGFCMVLLMLILRVSEKESSGMETSPPGDALIQLTPGTSVRRELADGAKDLFGISVAQGELLRFSIDKGDLVLSTTLYGPTGIKLLEHVSQDFEVVDLSFPAQHAGLYRIELQSQERGQKRAQYKLQLQSLQPVTAVNQKDSDARQAVARAETLRANWIERSLRDATEQYDRAVLIWTSIADFVSASHASLKSGDVYFLLSEYQEAAKRYQNAEAFAAKSNDWLAKARALSHMGRLYVHVGKNDAAQKQLTIALDLFEQHERNSSAIVANAYGEALSNLAEGSYSKGDFVKAAKQFESALKVFQSDRKGEAKVHLFLSYIAGSLGETGKAVREISHAGDLYRTTKNKTGEALAITTMGVSHSRKGDWSRAIEGYGQALEIFRLTGDRHNQAIALTALGEAHQNLKEYEIALDEYEKGSQLFQTIGALDGASVTTFQIAMVHALRGDLDQALAYYERCLTLTRAARKVRTEAIALTEIARIYAVQGRYELAFQQYERLLKFYESIGDLRGQAVALSAYGDLFLQHGEKRRALDSYNRALLLAEKMEEKEILISALYNLARAHLKLNALDVALSFIQRSLNIIEDVRASVESPEFRASYFSGAGQHYDLCIEILMQLDRQRPGEGFAVQAFLVREKSSARLLRDLVIESPVSVREGSAQELLERERGLRKLFRMQAQNRMDLLLRGKDATEIAEVESQMAQLRAQYQEVRAQLREQYPHSPLVGQSAPLGLEQIQKELPDSDTILLEYALGDQCSYLWAVTSNSVQSYELPPGKIIEDAARELYELITARQRTDGGDSRYKLKVETADNVYLQKATDLSQMLLGPVAGQLGKKRLLVVAEGALLLIPFDALPAPLAEATNPSEFRTQSRPFLPETNEVVALPSMTTLVAMRNARKHSISPDKLIAVIADPVFSRSDERVQSNGSSSSTVLAATDKNSHQFATGMPEFLTRDATFVRLAHASEEADAIYAKAPWGSAMVAKGFDASRETAMSSDFGQFQIIHFATHAYLDTKRPELSGIILSMVDRNGVSTDGLMSLHDIYNLDLSTELTVLSACQTALGKDIRGEGLVGLTHSFMSAGSKSVIATLWKVDDRATAVLMAEFYDAMFQKGMSPAAALRSAKLKMMRDPRWNAPYYWAGFVLQGEYDNHIAVDHYSWLRSRLVLLFLFSLSVIAAGVFMFQKRKRRFSPPRSS